MWLILPTDSLDLSHATREPSAEVMSEFVEQHPAHFLPNALLCAARAQNGTPVQCDAIRQDHSVAAGSSGLGDALVQSTNLISRSDAGRRDLGMGRPVDHGYGYIV